MVTKFKQIENLPELTALTGVAEGAANLGTFTGTTIADNLAIKAALQALETAVETSTNGQVVADIAARDALTGLNTGTYVTVTDASADGTVTNGSALYVWDGAAFQKLTEFEVQTNADALVTLSGLAAASTDLGTFTGGTITDNVAIKVALQELETALEAISATVTTQDIACPVTAANTNFTVTLSAAPVGAAAGIASVAINGIEMQASQIISVVGTTLTLNVSYPVDATDVVTTKYFA